MKAMLQALLLGVTMAGNNILILLFASKNHMENIAKVKVKFKSKTYILRGKMLYIIIFICLSGSGKSSFPPCPV